MVLTAVDISSDGIGMDSAWSIGEEEEKRLCIVEWKDIISCSGWEKASDVDCPTFKSVGWLVSDDEQTIKIASTLDYADAFGDAKDEAKPVPYGITAFPKGCVLGVEFT
jgi:hypothetical protein